VSSHSAGEEAEIGEHREEPDGGVALAHGEAVAIGPARLVRLHVEELVVEQRDDLGHGEGRAVMARAADVGEPHRLAADQFRLVSDERAVNVAHGARRHGISPGGLFNRFMADGRSQPRRAASLA
jgi:glycerol dehydrogenase-like iron-containing ADH family enzyme